MSTLNKFCEMCKDDWQGKRKPTTHAYFIGNRQWRGLCAVHANQKQRQGTFVVTAEALLKGSDITWEK